MPINEITGAYTEHDESDSSEYILRHEEEDNLRLWGKKSSPEWYINAVMNPDGTVTRTAIGRVREEDFTGPLKDIYTAQYGSWAEYKGAK